jgi:hypothetical protein
MDVDIIGSTLDSQPLYLFKDTPDAINDISFYDYSIAIKYISEIGHASKFLSVVTGLDEDWILKQKAVRVYPIYINYIKQCKQIIDMFNAVNDEVPQGKGKTPKTMVEFGMLNVVDYITNEKPELHSEFWDKPVIKIYILYRMKTYKMINTIANQPKQN